MNVPRRMVVVHAEIVTRARLLVVLAPRPLAHMMGARHLVAKMLMREVWLWEETLVPVQDYVLDQLKARASPAKEFAKVEDAEMLYEAVRAGRVSFIFDHGEVTAHTTTTWPWAREPKPIRKDKKR